MIEITGYEQNEAFIDLRARVQALREVCLDDVQLRPETVLKILGFKDDVAELDRIREERHQRWIDRMKETLYTEDDHVDG